MKKILAALFLLAFMFPVCAPAQDDDQANNPAAVPTPNPVRSNLKKHASFKKNDDSQNGDAASGSPSGGSLLGLHLPVANDTLRLSVSLDSGSGSMPIPAFTDPDGNYQPAYTISSMDYVAQAGIEKILGKFVWGGMGAEWGLKVKTSIAVEYWGTQQGPGEPGDYFSTNGFPYIGDGLHAGDEIDIHGFWWALSPEWTTHTELSPLFEVGTAVGISTYGHVAMTIEDPWDSFSTSIGNSMSVAHSSFLTKHLPGISAAPDWSVNILFKGSPQSTTRYYLETGMTGPDWVTGAGIEFLILPDLTGLNPPPGQPKPTPGPKPHNKKNRGQATPTATDTPTDTPTDIPEDTPTDTFTPVPTASFTPTATATATDTATAVPVKKAPTPTPVVTQAPTPVATASATNPPSTPAPVVTTALTANPTPAATATAGNPNNPLPPFVISVHFGHPIPLSQALQDFTDGGAALGGKLGYDVSPQWTLGLSFDYNDQFAQEVGNGNNNSYTPPDATHIPIEVFAQYHLDLGSRFFRPYVQLGLGVAIDSQGGPYTVNVNGTDQTQNIPKSTWINPEVDPALGFEFNFSDHFGAYLEGTFALDFGTPDEFQDNPIILIPLEMGLCFRL